MHNDQDRSMEMIRPAFLRLTNGAVAVQTEVGDLLIGLRVILVNSQMTLQTRLIFVRKIL